MPACNLLSVRIINYLFIPLSIQTQSEATSTELSYVLGFHCLSHLFFPTIEQDKMKIFVRLLST